MQILGIDYGLKKLGLALADSVSALATPYKVLKVKSDEDAAAQIALLVNEFAIEKIVIGLSGRQMNDYTKQFAAVLQKRTDIAIDFVDENYSTKMAQKAALISNIGQKKRKEMEDAYAAAIILQGYLDTSLS